MHVERLGGSHATYPGQLDHDTFQEPGPLSWLGAWPEGRASLSVTTESRGQVLLGCGGCPVHGTMVSTFSAPIP